LKCLPVIAVHGGAGHWRTKKSLEGILKYIEESLTAGMESMLEKNAVEGVLKAVMVLEDSGEFNAGLGSVPNIDGEIEMDAGIMDGSKGDAGAVAAVRYVKNPVLLAYYVLKNTNHVLIVGEGADRLAEQLGLEKMPIRERQRRDPVLSSRFWARKEELTGDTVGAVGIDSECRLAAASSTGGLAGKLKGRVGDTPIPGAGFYADENVAVVATGIGEVITLGALSRRVAEAWQATKRIEIALRLVLNEVNVRYGENTVGLLGVDIYGNVHAEYNTEAMPWGYLRYGENPVIKGLPTRM